MTSRAEPAWPREVGEAALMLRGHSPAMNVLRARLRLAAITRGAVLVVGGTGVGKGLAARFVHEASCGRIAPLIVSFCPAMGGEPLDHRRLLEEAAGGSLLIDEVSEMPLLEQDAFLEAERARDPRSCPVRLLATTRVDLEALVRRGDLREELYVRLAAMRVEVPPLRARLDDLPELTEVFLERAAARSPSAVFARPRLTAAALAALASHAWPGNVRELENVLERLVFDAREETIDVERVRAALVSRAPQAVNGWTSPLR